MTILAAFQRGGAGHLSALISILVFSFLLISAARRKDPSLKIWERILAAILILIYPAKIIVDYSIGEISLGKTLPFHLCDLAGFLGAAALLTRNQQCAELTYFWGLAGTLQGVLTPELAYDFPHPEFFRFFILHCAIIIAALYIVIGRRQWPRPTGALRALLWGILYMGFAAGINLLLRTNYGFLRERPSGGSMLDPFGEFYRLMLPVIALIMFHILYIPVWCARLHAKKNHRL